MRLHRRSSGGRSGTQVGELSTNFSLVLHECSDNPAVQAAIRSARTFGSNSRAAAHCVRDGSLDTHPDLWLAPTIGLHRELAGVLLAETGSASPVQWIDSGQAPQGSVTFFRAPAVLSLPEMHIRRTIGIAALVQRPGDRTSQLILRGPFSWPDQQQLVLSHLEAIIQAFIGQWQPQAELWSAPAEVLLPDEVGQGRGVGLGNSAASSSS